MNKIININSEEMTMGSEVIATLTSKRHNHVKRDIEKMFMDLDMETCPKMVMSKNLQNQTVEVYLLNKRETLILISGYNIKLRAKIIDRWEALENENHKIPQTFSEALLLAAEQTKQIETLEAQKQIDAPMVEFAKVVEGTTAKLSIGAFAKLSGKIGRNNLFKKLREHKILMANNIPYQNFIDSGYFETSETVIKRTSTDMITITTHVTGKGQLWLSKKIEGWL